MYTQDNVKSMISILEGQINELNSDSEKVEHAISKQAIKIAIKQLEESLKNVKDKLTK